MTRRLGSLKCLSEKMLHTALIVVLCVVASLAAPPAARNRRQTSVTASECNADDTWWQAGHLYRYRYTGRLDVGLPSDSTQATRGTLTIACDVHIQPLPACDYQMTLSECSLLQSRQDNSALSQHPESQTFAKLMSRYPVIFQSDNGIIKNTMNVHSEEPIAVANLKRGMVSTLQLRKDIIDTSAGPVDQETIHGKCPTEYSSEEGLGTTVVTTKIKISHCSGNRNIQQFLPFVRLQENTQDAILQVMQPKNATLECSHTLDEDNQLSSVECQERHLVRTFNGQTLLEAHARQSVSLVETTPSNLENVETRHFRTSTLMYESTDTPNPQQTTTRETMQHLQELIQSSVSETEAPSTSVSETEAPSTSAFKKLVGSLQGLSLSSLGQVLRKVSICRMWYCGDQNRDLLQSLFYDALAACGTGPCVKSLTGVLVNGDATGRDIGALLLGVAVSQNPTKAALRGILSICQCSAGTCDISPTQCLLPLSIMVHKYSQLNNPSQEPRNSPLLHSVQLLKQLIGDDCQPSDSNIASVNRQILNQITLTALKALSNVGQSAVVAYDSGVSEESQIIPALQRCISNKALHYKVSIAAIKAVERVSDPGLMLSSLLDVMEDDQAAVEVRSAAYISVMKAANLGAMRRVVTQMNTESIRQMKAFLTSSMQTILSSTDPKFRRMKNLLRNTLLQSGIVLPAQSPTSFGLSHSVTIGSEGTAAINSSIQDHLEAEVVYGTGSLVPTHSNLKVLLDVLGEHVNIAELGLDWQGFDFLGASLFKPEVTTDSSFSHFHQTVVQQLEELHSQIQHAHNNPEATLGLAMFGYNLGSFSVDQLGFISRLAEVQSPVQLWEMLKMDNLISSLRSGVRRHLSKAFLLPILHETIPTALGLPLNMTLDGTAMLQAQLDLSLGLGTVIRSFQDLNNVEVGGQLKISGTGDIESRLVGDVLGLASVGIQHQSNWRGQLHNEVSIHSNQQGLQLQLRNIPGVQHLHSSTKMGLIQDVNYEEIRETSEARPEPSSCMLSFIDKLTGWDLCGHQVAPSPPTAFPTVERLVLRLWHFVESKIPQPMKEMTRSLITWSDNVVTLMLPLPSLSEGSAATQPGSWVEYLQNVWMSVRTATIQPPQLYTAMVFGNNHIYTFDGHFYEFPDVTSNECTYVLARDFVDRNFTILRSKNSMTVLTREIAITIDENNKVKVNNSASYSDLPLQSWERNVTVTQSGPYVKLETSYGLTVKCNAQNSQCLISISGWYHNRTLGLLGTNDNEPSNDMRMRDGTITRNVQEFVNSFEVSGLALCRLDPQGPAMQQGPAQCISPDAARCRKLFHHSTSSLAPCFPHVVPQPFKEACELDMRQCGQNRDRTRVCSTTAAYAALCHSSGITVSQPSQCATCGENPLGSTWKLPGNHMADIVFVTSLHNSLHTATGSKPSQFLHSLVHGLRHTLHRNADYQDIRFGLVAFDGQGVHSPAHTHTIQGQVLVDRHSRLHLKRRLESLQADGAVAGTALNALDMAADYPFRSQAAKIVLLLTSTDVEHESTEANMTSLVQLQNKLQMSGITLDVVSEYQELRHSGATGIQWDGRMIPNNQSPPEDSTNLDFPQGDYAQLVRSTHGTVFDLLRVVGGTPQQRREFARTIVAQVTQQTQRCHRCTCAPDSTGRGVSRCRSSQC